MRHLFWKLKMFWQRGRRGWCEEDIWNMDSWLYRVIPEMLEEIKTIGNGYPNKYKDFGEWRKELETGIRRFKKIQELDRTMPHHLEPERLPNDEKHYQECRYMAMTWLRNNIHYLWD